MRPWTLTLSFGRIDADAQRQLADAQRAAAESDRAALEALTLVQQERVALERAEAARDESDEALTAAQRDRAAAEQAAADALALLDAERISGRAAVADLRRDVTDWQRRCREAEQERTDLLRQGAEMRQFMAEALGLPDPEIAAGWAPLRDAARRMRDRLSPTLTCYVCGAEPGTPCEPDCRLRADMRGVEDGR